MRVFTTDHFVLKLPPSHTFPMEKYRRLRERVEEVGLFEMTEAPMASEEELLRVHSEDWVRRVLAGELEESEVRRLGFPWSEALVERSRRSVGATVAASRAALLDGAATNLAGGTHHGFADHGEGYCVFNDVAVAVRAMQAEGLLQKAAVVDTDVHQGNGTAAIFADDPSVFTASIHSSKNYPLHKERSDLDLELPDRSGDSEYLEVFRRGLEKVFEWVTREGAELVYSVAGADAFGGDRLGRLALTKEGLAERDRLLVDACLQAGVGLVVVMAGGYARNIEDIVDIHAHSVFEARRLALRS